MTVSAAVVLPLCLVAQVGRPALGREPRRVGDYLAAQPQGTRVLNDYNVSGYLVFRAHNVRVAVDGRADRYGSAYLRRYADAVRGAPSWRKWVDSLDADVAVLPEDSVLPELLQHELGWKRLFTDDHLVVLRAPGAERG